jgi:hypothetical protein
MTGRRISRRRDEGGKMSWLALNIVLSAMFFAAWVGIPMWMVIKRPDTGREIAETTARVKAIPLHAVSRQEVGRWREREEAGAWRQAA